MNKVKTANEPHAKSIGINLINRILSRALALPTLALALLFGLTLMAPAHAATLCSATYAESGAADDTQYAFGQTAQFTGSGFGPLCDVTVRINRPDGQAEVGTITTDATGTFAFSYEPGTLAGNYVVSFLGEGATELMAISFSNGPVVMLDKGDVRDGETVHISGTAFAPLSTVIVRITRPDNSIVMSDGTPGSDSVAVDSIGDFAYDYIVRDGVMADYLVDVLDPQGNVLAATSFTDSAAFVRNIGTASTSGSGNSLTVTVGASGVAPGDSIIIGVAWGNTASPVTCSDFAGNSYTVDRTSTRGSTGSVSILSAHNVNALPGGSTITCTMPGASVARAMSANEFSGLVATAALDKTQIGNANSTAPNSGSTTTTSQNDELLFGAMLVFGGGNFTPGTCSGTSYTATNPLVAAGQVRVATEYAIATVAGNYAACGTLNQVNQWAAAIATYKISTVKDTTTTLTSSSNTSSYGDPVTFTASVAAGATPVTTGSVTFIEGGTCASPGTTLSGPTAVDPGGQAAFSTSALAYGSHTIVACYGGATGLNPSNGSVSQAISTRSITVTADAQSKTYGDADPALTYKVTSGSLVAGDSFSGALTRVPGENVGTYAILQGTLALSSSYSVTYVGTDLEIKKKDATWTTNAASKTYGDPDPSPLTTGSGSGFLPADGVSATYSRVGGETVTGGPYHITATLSATVSGTLSNYNVTNNGADFTINKRNAAWMTNSNSKIYGDPDPSPLTTGSGSGFLPSDGVSATYSRTPGETVAGSPYHIAATLSATVSGALSNYNVANNGAGFTINKRNAAWMTDPNSKTYGDLDPSPLTTGSGSGFLYSDGVSATYSRVPGETVAGGPYQISAALSAAVAGALSNYNITNSGAYFTINPANASVFTYTRSKFVNDPDPVPLTTGTLTGFLSGDQVTASYSRTPNQEAVGAYPILVTLSPAAVLSNYSITSNSPRFIIADVSGSTDPVAKGTLVSLTVTLPTGPDVPTCSIAWGDGAVTNCVTSHAYSSAGVYAPIVTLTDADNATTSRMFKYVVVYDPSAGFVTGGGWIISPVGAYTANPSLTGKANFGFVSKYQKGANVPTGNTEFQFQAANFNFKSTGYEWLVISGAKAQYKGSGTINGAGDYGFMLTGIDGSASGGADKLRLKVWDKGTNATIYDNQIGALDTSDTADPSTALGGGSIVVHK